MYVVYCNIQGTRGCLLDEVVYMIDCDILVSVFEIQLPFRTKTY